jgi:hypothetical protein
LEQCAIHDAIKLLGDLVEPNAENIEHKIFEGPPQANI